MVQGSKKMVTKAPTRKAPIGLVILEIILLTLGTTLQVAWDRKKSLNFKIPKSIAPAPKA